MWIAKIDPEVLREVLQESPSCYMFSGLDGEIYWANQSMLRWIGYTQGELQKLGWKKISVDSESLAADVEAANDMRTGRLREYYVEKQYIPKNGKPEWGQLVVQRYPVSGEFQFALCHWTPLKNGSAAAFTLAMDRCEKLRDQLQEMNTHISTLTNKSEEETWVLSTVRICQKHPRAALMFVVVALSVLGLNNTLELLQRVGLMPVPTVPTVSKPEQSTAYTLPEHESRFVALPD